MFADLLVRTPDIKDLEAGEARLATAIRLWVVLSKLGRCPLQAVADRLESGRAAGHLHLLPAEISDRLCPSAGLLGRALAFGS